MLNAKSRDGLTQPAPAEYATKVPMLKMLFPCNEGSGGITDLVSGVELKSSTGSEVWSQDANGIWGVNHEALDTVVGDLPYFHNTQKDMLFFIVLQSNYGAFNFSLGDEDGNNYVRMADTLTAGIEPKLRENGNEAVGAVVDLVGDLTNLIGGSIFMFRDSRVGGQSLRIYTGNSAADTGIVTSAIGASGLLLGNVSAMSNIVQKNYAQSQSGVRISGMGAFQFNQNAVGNITNLEDAHNGISWMTTQWRNSNIKKVYPNWINRDENIPAPA